MRISFALAVGVLCFGLSLSQIRADDVPAVPVKDKAGVAPALKDIKPVPAKDKAKVPVPHLSIGDFYARRDPKAVPPRITVAGFVQNKNVQTSVLASFSIDRWNGKSWTSVKSGAYPAMKANEPGADSVYLAPSSDAIKFRFVVTPSVEGSKEFDLPALPDLNAKVVPFPSANVPAAGKSLKDPPKAPLDLNTKVVPFPTDGVIGGSKAKIELLKLSIDQFYANRSPGGIVVAANMLNKNKQTVPESPYTIYQAKGSGWTRIKSGTPTAVKAGDFVIEAVGLPASNDAMKFKIEVSLSVQGSVECTLPLLKPAPVFVVIYRSNLLKGGGSDWQVYKTWEQDSNFLGNGPDIRKLKDLGFETTWSDRYYNGFFSSSHTITISFLSKDRLERTFTTQVAAKAFQTSLPQTGVESKIEQR
jgi:hypothetical protein